MKPKCDQVHLCLQDIAQPMGSHACIPHALQFSCRRPTNCAIPPYAAGQPLVAQARMQITLFFWPLKVLTSPLAPRAYLKDKVPFDTVKMFGGQCMCRARTTRS